MDESPNDAPVSVSFEFEKYELLNGLSGCCPARRPFGSHRSADRDKQAWLYCIGICILFVDGPSVVDPDGRRSFSRLEREEIV